MTTMEELQIEANEWLTTLEEGRRCLQVIVRDMSLRLRIEPEVDGGATALSEWIKEKSEDMLEIIWVQEEGPDPRLDVCIDWRRADGIMSVCKTLFEESRYLYDRLHERLAGIIDREDEREVAAATMDGGDNNISDNLDGGENTVNNNNNNSNNNNNNDNNNSNNNNNNNNDSNNNNYININNNINNNDDDDDGGYNDEDDNGGQVQGSNSVAIHMWVAENGITAMGGMGSDDDDNIVEPEGAFSLTNLFLCVVWWRLGVG
ncbi:hypothetical protein CBR_g50439 [Chara braunii]|uniref:Uncharacterized protein n=1 Tax=Chara braunii TaxID=69332 RepID=A0A388M6T1_CHABU|nr:hypothetical protein CBR_g50439 [Chara braunii]|eukprot:GBG90261.1 hypothetical protein CBR_g50439 [Chara braunii]